jgi:hypothetical protein
MFSTMLKSLDYGNRLDDFGVFESTLAKLEADYVQRFLRHPSQDQGIQYYFYISSYIKH